jgi:hypothetical protein
LRIKEQETCLTLQEHDDDDDDDDDDDVDNVQLVNSDVTSIRGNLQRFCSRKC